jgi:hypothetical protein
MSQSLMVIAGQIWTQDVKADNVSLRITSVMVTLIVQTNQMKLIAVSDFDITYLSNLVLGKVWYKDYEEFTSIRT